MNAPYLPSPYPSLLADFHDWEDERDQLADQNEARAAALLQERMDDEKYVSDVIYEDMDRVASLMARIFMAVPAASNAYGLEMLAERCRAFESAVVGIMLDRARRETE